MSKKNYETRIDALNEKINDLNYEYDILDDAKKDLIENCRFDSTLLSLEDETDLILYNKALKHFNSKMERLKRTIDILIKKESSLRRKYEKKFYTPCGSLLLVAYNGHTTPVV